jgi:hypothetical protein
MNIASISSARLVLYVALCSKAFHKRNIKFVRAQLKSDASRGTVQQKRGKLPRTPTRSDPQESGMAVQVAGA